MGIQVLVRGNSIEAVKSALGAFVPRYEVFPVEGDLFGVSVPTAAVDSAGEQTVLQLLASVEHYEMWSGVWRKPKSKWKLW